LRIALHQQVALGDAHLQGVAVGLRQRLVEDRSREMQAVVRTTGLEARDGQDLDKGSEDFTVELHLGDHLLGVGGEHGKREIADCGDDPGDVSFQEELLDIVGQVIDIEFQQAGVGALEQLHVDVEHRQ
jgi:hypothetical protein